jgi:hypothetical protein
VDWTIRATGRAGRELDGAFFHHRHDELRRRMVGNPIGIAESNQAPLMRDHDLAGAAGGRKATHGVSKRAAC